MTDQNSTELKLISDVEQFMKDRDVVEVLTHFDDIHQKYRFLQLNLMLKQARLKRKFPELQKTLECFETASVATASDQQFDATRFSKKGRKDDTDVHNKNNLSNEKLSDDVETLLSLASTRERESKKLGEELVELLSKPSAKERRLLERFKSADGYQVQEFCPKGTKEECRRVQKSQHACDKLHFKKIISKHTDESLGDCSFLNTCFNMATCKYVHYEVDYSNYNHQTTKSSPLSPKSQSSASKTGLQQYNTRSNSTSKIIDSNSQQSQQISLTSSLIGSISASSTLNSTSNDHNLISRQSPISKKLFKKLDATCTNLALHNKLVQGQSKIHGQSSKEGMEILSLDSFGNPVGHDEAMALGRQLYQTAEEQAANDLKKRRRFKTVLCPPQWIQCDLRFFDMSILGKFSVVMADPPWDIHMELPYGTMSDDEMRKLNIPSLQDDGIIFLWVTGRAMELGRECLALWGYERCDEIIWVKTNQLQRIIRTGRTGHWLNHGKEHCLVGIKGQPRGINRGLDCDVIVAEVRATSHKPDEIYGIIERLSPGTRKIELFGRQHNVQPNWITLGNQLDGVRLVDPVLVSSFKRINKTN